jgi:hypothetical protein
MTDLQDEICDRLVGAKVGPNWVGGPLHVAALVIDPSFVPAVRGDKRPGQFARAVGWPVAFCEAVIGANAALGAEADRRALAISLFTRVPPARRSARAAPAAAGARPAAAWAVLRGHESACGAGCPLHRAAVAALAAVDAGRKWPGLFVRGTDCATAPKKWDARVAPTSPAAHHAAVAMRYLDGAMQSPTSHYLLADAFRESAKAETKAHGLDGAVAFCLALAAKLGLTATDGQGGPGS